MRMVVLRADVHSIHGDHKMVPAVTSLFVDAPPQYVCPARVGALVL